MRQSLICVVLLAVLSSGIAPAQEISSPYGRLHEQDGLAPLDSVISRLWQTAWPARDWDALYEAGPRLLNALPGLIDLDYSSHNGKKYDRYTEHSAALEKYIIQYGAAAGNKDSGLITVLLPHIRAELDIVMATIRPTPYPAFERLYWEVEYFITSQPDTSDDSGLTAAVDTILAHMVGLEQGATPEDLGDKAALVREEFSYYKVLAEQMKDALIKGDRSQFRRRAIQLQTRLNNFVRLYLQ